MKMTSMKQVPIIAVSTVMIAVLAAAKVRSRKRRRSKSGEEARSSHQIQRARSATAATNSPAMTPEVQPQSLPWMMARVRQKRPAVTRPTPGQSSGAEWCSSRRPRARASASTIPSAPAGTLNQKTAGQPQRSTSTPPSTGPAAAAAELSAPKSPAAKPCRSSGKARSMSASEVGTTAAAPTACTTRQATSASTVAARAQKNEAPVKSARPSTKNSLWP